MSTREELIQVRADLYDALKDDPGIQWRITHDDELVIGRKPDGKAPLFITLNAADFNRLLEDIQDHFAPDV
jgi:hypothetical protein